MIVLDTNVVSALMRVEPDVAVLGWVDRQNEPMVITSVTECEIRFGLGILPAGKRRDRLMAAFEAMLAEDFGEGGVLPLDQLAARRASEIAVMLRATGQPAGDGSRSHDAFIAGITSRHGATLATGNIKHFEPMEISTANPWA